MTIDVVLNPAEIALLPQRDLSTSTCVVFDVLRATSSMVTALAHGAAEIRPVRTIDDALLLKQALPHAVLGGERHGDRIEGFDIGNSPFEYRDFPGRTIISTTTNGTIALRACEGAQRVLVGAILNLDAVAAELRRAQPEQVVIVCAGTFADFALEDAYGAGLLVEALGDAERTDSANAAFALTKLYARPIDALREARNGKALLGKARDAEVEWCAKRGELTAVGVMHDAVIRLLDADVALAERASDAS